jgi:hypothetical protein
MDPLCPPQGRLSTPGDACQLQQDAEKGEIAHTLQESGWTLIHGGSDTALGITHVPLQQLGIREFKRYRSGTRERVRVLLLSPGRCPAAPHTQCVCVVTRGLTVKGGGGGSLVPCWY